MFAGYVRVSKPSKRGRVPRPHRDWCGSGDMLLSGFVTLI